MKNHPLQYLIFAVAIMLLVTMGSGANVLAQTGETVFITSPADRETVSGLITVTGAVDFSDFLKYEIFLSGGGDFIWAATTYAPVINGDLAILDTRVFFDGSYQMIIRKVALDSNYTDTAGPTIIIENNLGAPLPYPEIETGLLYTPLAGALARLRNCGGNKLEFDYGSPEGFCSSGSLWLDYKAQDSPTCPYVDIPLVPCEYRGTARGLGDKRPAVYSFRAEEGKVYELNYPGGAQIFINEIPGRPRASTDTGDLDPDDPARYQSPPDTTAAAAPAAAAPAPTTAPDPAPAVAAPTDPADASDDAESMLPVSGQGTESNLPFIVMTISLILFLIVGGIVAVRKRRYTA